MNINKYSCISFDVFDTAIKRNIISPADVVRLTYQICQDKYKISSDTYVDDRIKAEYDLFKESCGEKLTLDNIYARINMRPDEKILLMETEKQVETAMCQANYDIMKLYEKVDDKEKIIFISDIFYDSNFVSNLLNKSGYISYKKVYTSADEKLTKHTGKLYEKIKTEKQPVKDKWLHIGDSLRGDCLVPMLKGIKTKKTGKTKEKKIHYERKDIHNLTDNVMYSVIINNISTISEPVESLGFEILGPLLFGFCKWLNENVETSEEILFLSRDGFVMQKAYDRMFPQIHTEYFETSRNCMINACLYKCKSMEEIIYKLKLRKYESLAELLVGFEIDNEDILPEYENIIVEREHITDNEKIMNILNGYFDRIIAYSNKQRELLLRYLRKKIKGNKIALVDLGWNGSIQDYLQWFIDDNGLNYSLNGYYVSLNNTEQMEKKSYLGSKSYSEDIVFAIRGAVEVFFSSDKPRCAAYGTNDFEEVISVYSRIVKSETGIRQIKQIQKGALSYIETLLKIFAALNYNANPSVEFCNAGMYRLAAKPACKDVAIMSEIRFDDVKEGPLIGHSTMFNFNKELYDSDWRIGCMKKYIGINLPYDSLMKKIKRISMKRKK